jgi:hypothetical protein
MQETQRVAMTWELLFDPATFCFGVGGVALIVLTARGNATRSFPISAVLKRCVALLLVLLAWAPIRVALLVAVVLHRSLRADPLAAPNVGSVLVNVWVHLLLLAVPLVLVIRFSGRAELPLDSGEASNEGRRRARASRPALAACLAASAVAMLVGAWFWVPVGTAKQGRVMVVERHSTWEPTTEPYGTEMYGEAGSYNYAAAYAYCEQYFEMLRLLPSDSIDQETLRRCDVLIIKTPTERYSTAEIQAVIEFVEDGGSLLLVGDHTNVFNMNTYLNDVSRRFGFTFRNDLLFQMKDPYKQPYHRPVAAHPIVQHVPPMHFAVSCSIDPGISVGRAVIRSTGLWSLPPAYHESNYHPQAEYRPRVQYGAWCQLWATTFGDGRVLAFADSTLFSNFCVFQPGKAELLRGMLDWLNHRSHFDSRVSQLVLCCLGALVAMAFLGLAVRLGGAGHWVMIVCAGLFGWSAAVFTINIIHHRSLPVPPVKQPLVHVAIDRTVSEVPLFTGAFTDGEEGVGYGMFEQWIPRVGNFLSRYPGDGAFGGDALVIICPTRSVSLAYRERLKQFVHAGGHVLVLDSIDVEQSTANSLLWPFKLASNHSTAQMPEGELRCAFSPLRVPLLAACEIQGGEPLAWLGEMPVAARARYGEGTVTAIGFAPLFNDANMGHHWLPEPDPEVRQRYEVLYGLLRVALPVPGIPGDVSD